MRLWLTIKIVMLAALLAVVPVVRAEQAAAVHGSGFAPLDQWREAVIAGDKAALATCYLPDSPAYAQMADGRKATSGDQEPAFWSSLRAQGLADLAVKILEQDTVGPNEYFLVLRVEITAGAPFGATRVGETRKFVMAVRQTWVKSGDASHNAWHIVATRRSDLGPMESISLPQPATPNPHLYPNPADAQKELTEALTAARKDHKRVLVIFGASWCYDCHVLDATLRSRAVAPLVAANYHVIHISIGDGDQNADMAERFQVPLEKGIPSLAVLDADGRLITSQKQGEFESAARIGMKDVTGFLNRWKPPLGRR